MIGGIIEADRGRRVRAAGGVAALLELGAGFHPDLTGRENVYLNAAHPRHVHGRDRRGTSTTSSSSRASSEFIDTQVKFYSSGMYVRLAFSVAVHVDPDLLLVDEVLAVGDEPFQRKCMDKIRSFQKEGRTIVLVSHSAEQVADVCTRVVVLDGGRVVHDGDVGTGIRVLREGYERDRLAGEEHAPGEAAHPAVEIDSVTLSGPDGRPLGGAPLPRGTDVELTIHAHLHEPIEWVTGFSLHSTLGQIVYRLNTEGLGLELPTVPGRYDVRFVIPATNFGFNRLVVSAGATDGGGEPIALLDPAGTLDFADDPIGAGVVQFEASGTVTPIVA